MSNDTDAPVNGSPSPRAMALARAIRAVRGSMPQVEFVAHANRPQSVVSNWETGKQTPTLETLAALELSLGLPLGTLATRAGYFTAEAAFATEGGRVPVSSLRFVDRSDAIRAVQAADGLGLDARLRTVRASDEDPAGWLVEVLAPDRGTAEAQQPK